MLAIEWRDHPKLGGRLDPQHPDDVQVIVHDGGPRMTDRRPEAIWVSVVGVEGDVFTGEVLNETQQLVSVRQGDRVQFVVPDSGKYPIMVRPKCLKERGDWVIHACDRCGMSELFDAPSDLIAKVFPNIGPGEVPEMFTVICGMCGGVQGAERKGMEWADAASSPDAGASTPSKKWWQFWK